VPTTVTSAPPRADTPEPRRKLWTRAECDALEATGLWDQQKLELIEGELIDKMGKKRPHTNAHTVLFAWLIQVFGWELVNQETPIDVAPEDNQASEPQPDIIVLTRSSLEIQHANPQPGELALVVEIADSSVRFDLSTKARLYARAGISEYWVLDVTGRQLIVHRQPTGGQYASIVAYDEQESVAPLAAPGHEFQVRTALPRR
jgi:Uma2 family endonuclease